MSRQVNDDNVFGLGVLGNRGKSLAEVFLGGHHRAGIAVGAQHLELDLVQALWFLGRTEEPAGADSQRVGEILGVLGRKAQVQVCSIVIRDAADNCIQGRQSDLFRSRYGPDDFRSATADIPLVDLLNIVGSDDGYFVLSAVVLNVT